MARSQNTTPPAGASAPQGMQPQETAEQKAAREAAEVQAKADAKATKEAKTKTVVVSLRHKTPYAIYRRAGVVIGKVAADYSVNEEQLAVLETDALVEVVRK